MFFSLLTLRARFSILAVQLRGSAGTWQPDLFSLAARLFHVRQGRRARFPGQGDKTGTSLPVLARHQGSIGNERSMITLVAGQPILGRAAPLKRPTPRSWPSHRAWQSGVQLDYRRAASAYRPAFVDQIVVSYHYSTRT
ncbi:hypothetical protein F4780DRAFT_481611 [Xylariomycetidae sp. FL0641]|nr:hypothetical protein F4780DRAFT_481611 [Xylariomycetidae sp. FL0641]